MTTQQTLVFNIQRYSLADGPGIRTTIFLKGCPLRCLWCHNPESLSSQIQLSFNEARCIRCGQCEQVKSPEEKAQVCPTESKEMVGKWMEAAELLREILKDQAYFESSGGGVTFSGGEPLMQSAFLISFLPQLQQLGLHVTIDTCGQGKTQDLLALAPHTDLFLYDIKMMDTQKHQQLAGVGNELILNNLKRLAQIHGNISLRIPILPGINDGQENMEQIAQLALQLPSIKEINLLPYHRSAVAKYERLGQKYPVELNAMGTPDPVTLNKLAESFSHLGIKVRVGG
ncbi:MAG: glycyl-radical enzyme activating protein [Pseudomonadota bacterium]